VAVTKENIQWRLMGNDIMFDSHQRPLFSSSAASTESADELSVNRITERMTTV
jgi:hypothetical protein